MNIIKIILVLGLVLAFMFGRRFIIRKAKASGKGVFKYLGKGFLYIMGRSLRIVLRFPFSILLYIGAGLKAIVFFILGFQTNQAYGSAQFLNFFTKRRLLAPTNRGLFVNHRNRLSLKNSYTHLALIAPTGAGKSTKYVIPNLINIDDSCSVIVTDPSGELYDLTSGYLSSRGFKIKVINVSDPEKSLFYNPLHRISTGTDIRYITDILVDAAYPDSSGDQKFWNDGAKSIINILISCLKNESEEYQNLANVLYLLKKFGTTGEKLDGFISRNANEQIHLEYQSFLANDDKVLKGFISSAKNALGKFSDAGLAYLTAKESLNFEELRTEKCVLYINVPEHEIKFYGFFLSILYTQLFNFAMEPKVSGQTYQSLFFLMDEFGNSGTIPNFSTLITTLRKRQCSCSLILQDLEQLTNNYGRSDASTILNGGCTSQIYFPGLSYSTCEQVSNILGQATITHNEKGFMSNEREKDMGRKLLNPDEIRTLDDNQSIYIFKNKRPVLLNMKPYFKDKKLLRRTKKEAHPLPSSQQVKVEHVPLT